MSTRLTAALAACVGVLILSACTEDEGKQSTASTTSLTQREFHAVGIYEGYGASSQKVHKEGGFAKVIVDRPGKQVTLLLTAHESTTWLLEVRPGTTMAKVWLAGGEPQKVTGLSDNVPVVTAWGEGPYNTGRLVLPYAYDVRKSSFRWLSKLLRSHGMGELDSFHGSYAVGRDRPFVIDALATGHAKEMLSPDYPTPAAPTALPEVTYVAVQRDPTAKFIYGRFTQAGPVSSTLRPTPGRSSRVAVDVDGGRTYVLRGHGIHEHRADGLVVARDFDRTLPPISRPSGMTFDSKRQRVLIVTYESAGELYSYDTVANRWSVLTSMKQVDLASLTYSKRRDALYGVTMTWSDGTTFLVRYTPDGEEVGRIKLDDPLLYGMLSPWSADDVQLADGGDQLVLIADEEEPDRTVLTRTFILDPDRGKAVLARVDERPYRRPGTDQ
jgi:hypothetical protein